GEHAEDTRAASHASGAVRQGAGDGRALPSVLRPRCAQEDQLPAMILTVPCSSVQRGGSAGRPGELAVVSDGLVAFTGVGFSADGSAICGWAGGAEWDAGG